MMVGQHLGKADEHSPGLIVVAITVEAPDSETGLTVTSY